MKKKAWKSNDTARRWVLLFCFGLAVFALIWRAVYLQLLNNDFLKEHGDARSVRNITIPAHRGVITDRNGVYLAVSTPVQSVWCIPRKLLSDADQLLQLAEIIEMDVDRLKQRLSQRIDRDFLYLRRHINPDRANQVRALNAPGVHLETEYKRYYPAGEVTAHIIGFTNIDDVGQEGIELAYDGWLRGKPGKRRVLKDRLGRVIEHIASVEAVEPGRALALSIDQRIQYLAYRELKAAVMQNKAKGGSLIMLDAATGEVLAMVSQPAYNPNNRSSLNSKYYRNRAVVDVFEPGSTIKPFIVSAALSSNVYQPDTPIDASPGYFYVDGHIVRDIRDYGLIDVATVIKKSSNVGASKIALSLDPDVLWSTLSSFGFGQPPGSAYPGEAPGILTNYSDQSKVRTATLAFGYGMSVSALQLVRAYSAIAADGVLMPVSFIREEKAVNAQSVVTTAVARQIKAMMEDVVSAQGTGSRAAVYGYRVAGKTGTARKSNVGGYADDLYLSLFVGMAPVSQPRFVMIVTIDEPGGLQYYGGQIAAPVFSKVMRGALRIMNIPLDDRSVLQQNAAAISSTATLVTGGR